MVLLIPIERSQQVALENRLDRVAISDWRETGQIRTFPITSPVGEDALDELFDYCSANRISDLLIPNRTHLKERELREAGYEVHVGKSIANLVKGDGLQKHLEAFGLDWRSRALERLTHYTLGKVTEREVNQWLLQFEHMGNHRTVGETLLKLLDVLSPNDLGEAVCSNADFFGDGLVVGFNKDRWGKSWTVVSNLVRKRCPQAKLLPIDEAIVSGQFPCALRLVEDGLFSGTEVSSIFDSLRGVRGKGKTQKVKALKDPESLRTVSAQMYFAAVCDLGEMRVRRYMERNGLPNIQINVNAAARKIRVLLAEGTRPPGADCTDKEFADGLLSQVVPFAFQAGRGWRDSDDSQRGQEFCTEVGRQLWWNYISRQPGFDPSRWPDDRVNRCALGMEGLGLAFAFAHSVPRATLPLFWASGIVTLGGRQYDWRPLLPNAET